MYENNKTENQFNKHFLQNISQSIGLNIEKVIIKQT